MKKITLLSAIWVRPDLSGKPASSEQSKRPTDDDAGEAILAEDDFAEDDFQAPPVDSRPRVKPGKA